ncbi:MAG TPA: LamG-like jellyroll fold domain-containing protein [Planctomycetota bacterium]|nr:LamG-like jellyroll fold domain-containing protein [Planctomycetota bacterium]
MGHEIVYCVQCATRIPGIDFERGKAFKVGGKHICAACLPTLSLEEQKEASLSSTRIKAAKTAASQASSVRIQLARPVEAPVSSGSPMLLVCGAGLLMALAGVAIFALSRGSRPVETSTPVVAPSTVKAPAVPLEKPEDAALRDAQAAIELARAKMKAAPDNLDAQAAAWEEALRKTALTPLYKEASSGLQDVINRRAALKSSVPVLEKPIEKPVVKAPVEVPPTKPPSPELKAFQVRWDSAMAKASARDFEGAITDLGRIAAEINDEDLRKGVRADMEDLKLARTTLAEVQGALASLSRGQSVELTSRPDGGERAEARGVVLRANPHRVELRQGEAAVVVEAEDLTMASLARLRGNPADAERRALAILCLLEGDREGADGLVAIDSLATRFWSYAAAPTARAPKPAPREIEARRRFYEAEREFVKMETMASAVLKYKSLAADYADTRVVKSEQVRIQKRSESARDYVLVAGALKGTGTFALSPAPRTEVAWTSKLDVEGDGAMLGNYVEVEFAALADTAYRCWALVGGCCAENFTFYLQTTDGTDVNPKTKQKAPIDPGSGLASLVKHSISGLKKTHEEHKIQGGRARPKSASRWEWVSIPLPKYSSPGAKKIRLLSDQLGFGVGAIVVSSTRSVTVPDPELKEEVARVRSLYAAREEGLVGWWKLDEGSGSVASDSVEGGHSGVVHGVPKWVPGKIGSALKFELGDYVTIDTRSTFKTVTLTAWVKHDSFVKEQQRYVSLSNETAVLRCNGDRTLHFYIRTNGTLQQMMVPDVLEAGKWTHVAGTWDGTTQKLYKDGVLLDSKTPGGSMQGEVVQVLFGHNPEFLRGALDEVRVYDRALSEAEIRKQAANEAPNLITEIVPPPPVGKPWRPLFDGTLSIVKSNRSWKLDNGALAYIPGTDDAAQTREQFSDGEVRIRFEVKDANRLWFAFRQGSEPPYGIRLDEFLKALDEKTHELIIVGKGAQVTATLDGKPVPVEPGSAKSGCIQFNAAGRICRIVSWDVR